MKQKIAAVIGARPQFIKHAPMEKSLSKRFDVLTIHTGQHYDENMSAVFFDELDMAPPKYNLNVGSKTHTVQTANIMVGLEDVFHHESPDFVLVYGDTNSTLAGALVASKMNIPIGHVEAGIRSFNRSMPEEVNRVLTDHVSSLLFAPTESAIHHLAEEGIHEGVTLCGDVMYDLLLLVQKAGLIKQNTGSTYYYATIHRPYNTDEPVRLRTLFQNLDNFDHEVIFSIHPRTRNLAKEFDIYLDDYRNIRFIDPVSYLENINYMFNSKALITDSGGMQKEAYFLKKQCVTIRSETEWTETLEHGWNSLCFDDFSRIKSLLNREPGYYNPNLYGNGEASKTITNLILDFFN